MKPSPEKFLLRVVKGALAPADGLTERRLREKGYHVGDVLSATLTKPRNPEYHRLAHQLGTLIADNIEDFTGMDSHSVLKRLQWEAGVGCQEMGAKVPGAGFVTIRIPLSLSFATMDEGTFKEVIRGLSRYIAANYWKTLSPEQIEDMAKLMPDD